MNTLYRPPTATLSDTPAEAGIPDQDALFAFLRADEKLTARARDWFAGRRARPGFSPWAFVFGAAWFFARGLYGRGFLMMAVQVVLPWVLLLFCIFCVYLTGDRSELADRVGFGVFYGSMLAIRLACAWFAFPCLLRRARDVVRAIDLRGLSEWDRRRAIAEAGELRVWGPIVFIVLGLWEVAMLQL